jgi:DNA-binding response OmpR family regulator
MHKPRQGADPKNAPDVLLPSWPVVAGQKRLILVVGVGTAVAEAFAAAFAHEGWSTAIAPTLVDATRLMRELDPSVVVLGRRLPDGDGLGLLRAPCRRSRTGFIVIAGDEDEFDRIVALELGADDAVAEPCSSRELTARVRAVARRLEAETEPPASRPVHNLPEGAFRLGAAVADTRRRRLLCADGRAVALTEAEAGLLSLLASAEGAVVERDRVAADVLGWPALRPGQRSVDQLAFALRRKLAAATAGAAQLMAVRNHGYRLIA